MEFFKEIFSLYGNTVYISLLIGFVCPLVGTFLVLRRMIFLGVALPQISSTGVAVALSMHIWFGHADAGHGMEQRGLTFIGSTVFSLLAILWLAVMERRGKGITEGRIGTAYVVATAVSLLLLSKCPTAEQGWLHLLKGEIIAVSAVDLQITGGAFAAVLVVLLWFRKEFILVSFDREMALTLKKNVLLWDVLLYLLIGMTISVAVLSVGPLISFGFLLIPALTAHLVAANMRQFAVLASLIGGAAAFAGCCIAVKWDLPVGPTDIALLGALYFLVFLGRKLFPARMAESARA